ncbi:MerR family transcriptional regulator [Kroppenstedtia eburnea]|uniref:MerR family transcriptional regulator, glutamine synthetase repressor n=1 Tax=Kroppenstedtia eburnea TaxID=714067 RepID=A0A1N7ISZ7_9BACL|nr:MerR family transcriptional regulator [Kroppenstedtia eburnea]QKI82173.1 MerR family transcriptional regulator [Kroppenstedtia eburnea]SIS40229.1 MerR family transcriptional regulator, glutamine synthetase repressor [Kroppenstedtia eburnea]
MCDDFRRNLPLFPMGTVTQLTELTPRQIRYYEQQGLIHPARTRGKQRLFSFNDVDLLLRIKSLMEKGINIAGVKEVLREQTQALQPEGPPGPVKADLSKAEVYKLMKRQLHELSPRPNQSHLIRGELARFFH